MNDVINALSVYEGEHKKHLVQAPQGQEFWVHNGPALRNLKDLRDVMDRIEEEQFGFHVNDFKNDFVSWVKEVLKDSDCAKALQRCKTPLSTKRTVIKFLKQYA